MKVSQRIDSINIKHTVNFQMSDDNGFSCSSPSNWFPLATHQLRLRSISEIHLFHPSQSEESDKLDHLSPSDDNPRHQTSCDDKLFHLTFHETALSSPFYTTKRVCLQEERLTWTEIDQVRALEIIKQYIINNETNICEQ